MGIMLILLSSLTNSASADEETRRGQSYFKLGDLEFRLEWHASQITTVRYGTNSRKVVYNVYGNKKQILPEALNGGTVIGCSSPSSRDIIMRAVGKPQIGWILSLGGICGATNHAFKHIIILPSEMMRFGKRIYFTFEIISPDTPVMVNLKNGNIQFWSTYQEWGKTGTYGSFFVPELRVLTSEDNYNMLCPSLPKNFGQWPNALKRRSFIGDYYAGLVDLNADVMLSALMSYDEIDFEYLRLQGLPTKRKELQTLSEAVRTIRRLRSKISTGFLPWEKNAWYDEICAEKG